MTAFCLVLLLLLPAPAGPAASPDSAVATANDSGATGGRSMPDSTGNRFSTDSAAPFPGQDFLTAEDSASDDLDAAGETDAVDSAASAADTSGASFFPDTLTGLRDSSIAVSPDSADTSAHAAPVRPAWLYPALSLEQDSLARRLLGCFYRFDRGAAERWGKKMQRLEKKKRLPPLSYLLMTGTRVLRVQNGDYNDAHARKGLIKDIEKLSRKGLELSDPGKSADSCRAVNLLITGGIKGFVATLDIEKNPVNAALNGFAALKFLDQASALDSTVADASLGQGLFNCILAKSPAIVRGALAMVGKDVSLQKGLSHLRRSAYRGCYTNDIAALYLVSFLSPYLGHEAAEKQRLLRSLQRRYPQNPWFVFLEIEENLCFHPASLSSYSFTLRVKRQITRFRNDNYCLERYANLVRWQYLLIDPFPASGFTPDTTFDLKGFSYYPVFLQALREKFLYEREASDSKRDRARRLRFIRAQAVKAARMLDASEEMPHGRKGLFLWHIRDGLRVAEERERK